MIAAFGVVALIQSHLATRHWPNVGHDYAYLLPRLLDVQLHYAAAGLCVQWWTPTFGAGLPAFANPQHTQFMAAQFLVPWLEPYHAAIVSSVMTIAFGGLLVCLTCHRCLGCRWPVSLLAGLAFATNGFSLQRLLVGHLSFASFPLMACVPLLLDVRTRRALAVALLGLFWAIVVFSGGYAVGISALLTMLLLAPLLPFVAPDRFKVGESFERLFAGGLLGVTLAAVKIAAVGSWLQQIPRAGSVFPTDALGESLRILLRLGWWEWTAPACLLPGTMLQQVIEALFPHEGFWEHDQGVAFPVWVFVIAAIPLMRWTDCAAKWKVGVLVCAAIWLTLEFSLARGIVWPVVHRLPLFSSLHANMRFGSAFILPLILVGAGAAQRIFRERGKRAKLVAAIFCGAWILGSHAMRFAVTSSHDYRNFDATTIQRNWTEHVKTGEAFRPIASVHRILDAETFQNRASSLEVYEPIFGYGRPGKSFKTSVSSGPIMGSEINFHFPPAFLFPPEAGTSVFSPPPLSERANVEMLLVRRQPAWPLPARVRIAGMVSVVGWFAVAALLAFALKKRGPESLPAQQKAAP